MRTLEETGRPAGRLAFAFAVYAPSRGRVEVLRSGQPGMDAGLAAPGHGWPMAAGPRSRTGARACRATARHRTTGARALGYLGLFQVTRCKSETNSRRDRRNGYVSRHQPTLAVLLRFQDSDKTHSCHEMKSHCRLMRSDSPDGVLQSNQRNSTQHAHLADWRIRKNGQSRTLLRNRWSRSPPL
jgi:hypothetical protein